MLNPNRLAYDSVYTTLNDKGIAPIARNHFEKGTIMEIVDHKIKEETNEHVFCLSKVPNKESLDIFLDIATRCVADTQAPRPRIEIVIKELKKALYCQENHKDSLKLSLADVKLATQDFGPDNPIRHGDFGNIYRGEVTHAHVLKIIAAKRVDKKTEEREAQFVTELEILMEYKHKNVIGLVGYCDEEEEKIIVYQYGSRGTLDKYLSDDSLTWVMRLKICINIAIGLEFLHGTISSPEMVIHRDINSSNILLLDDWNPKNTNFGLSLVCPKNHNGDYLIDNVTCTIGYSDPLHSKTGFLTEKSDIFSLGAILFDIMCRKISSVELDNEYLYLPFLAKSRYQVGKLEELVFEGIKEQIVPHSFAIFSRIAYQCILERRERRPTAGEVIIQLNKALEFQEDYEIWEPKLPKDYQEIIMMSNCPKIYSTKKKEELYNIFSKGILLQQDKVRDKDWMMIELYQFLNQNEDVDFEFILESFSTYYCGDGAIFVEGVEFRAIDLVKHEETRKLKEIQQVLKSNFNVEQLPTKFEELFKIQGNYDELFWLGEVNDRWPCGNLKGRITLQTGSVWFRSLGVPLFSVSKPCSACSRVFAGDIYGDHAVSCAGIIGIKHRHNVVRDTLVDICFRSGISAGKEVDIGLDGGCDKKLRPADMLLYSWDGGLDAVVDVAHRKRGKYMAKCAAIGYGFLPFSFSSLGELEADAVSLLKRIRKFSVAQDIGARAAMHIFSRISFSIAKGVGAQIAYRLPSNLLLFLLF
ncbi:kinase-like domain, phloem protein 2-like protein [Tanacetum coccineum]